MAKVTFTIEDIEGGKVRIEATPNFQTIAMMAKSGHELTAAHGYALRMIRAVNEAAKESGSMKIILPREGLKRF
jgi:hypothetical protein